jgi:FkbM family methyltransferase
MLGRSSLQSFWERLYHLTLAGMNIGHADAVGRSGEVWTVDEVARRLEGVPELVVFDVGSNVGDWTDLVLDRIGPRARVYAFEPQRAAFERLEQRLGGRDRVRLLNFGAGEADETRELWALGEASALGSVYQRDLSHFDAEMTSTGSVQLRRLDEFCAQEGIERINFLKIDVEGHELAALKGCGDLLGSGRVDFIQFEFGGTNIDSRTYFRDLYNLLSPSFAIHRVLRDGLREIDGYRETWEIFTATNFLAVSRAL